MPERTPPINDPRPNRFPRKKGFSGNRPNKPSEIDKNKFIKASEISENDMTDYPIGDGKEYPTDSNMPMIRGTLPPGFVEPQEIKKGGMTKGQKKISKVMREFKKGELHSGKKGPVVKSRKQAIAIALSEAGMSKPKQMSVGGDVVVGKGQDYIKDLI